MPVKAGQIVKNLIPSEAVIVAKIQSLGSKSVSLKFTGVNSNCAKSKGIFIEDCDHLELLADEDASNFKVDADKFALFVETERINSAFQFDPFLLLIAPLLEIDAAQLSKIEKRVSAIKKGIVTNHC